MGKPEDDCSCSETPIYKGRGGKRPNSGRKFQNKTKHFFGLKYSPEEFEEIEKKFSFLKKNLKMNNTQLLKYIIKNFNLN